MITASEHKKAVPQKTDNTTIDECEKIADTLSKLSLFKLDIEKDILNLIAEYSRGNILNCCNSWCKNEVLILSEHKCDGNANRPKPKPKKSKVLQDDGTYKIYTYQPSPDEANKIPDRSFNDAEFNIKYYYDRDESIAYCYECRKIMLLCCKNAALICDGIVFDIKDANIKNDSYILCACPAKVKMCLKHGYCDRCKLSSCCSWSGQHDDNCEPRNCTDCTQNGCLNCIEMTEYEECLECDPPTYEGAVYKCKNNQCLAIMKTIFNNKEDYADFRFIYDILKEMKIFIILNIEDTIVIEIAEYCTGRLLNCKNKQCDNEVLILNQDKRIKYDIGFQGYEEASQYKGYTYQDSQYKNVKYIYRPWGNIVYCHTCIVGNKATEPNNRLLYMPTVINVTNQ